MNSRHATRNAKALAGSCAFVRVCLRAASVLPMGQALDQRESEDPPVPGGRRV